MTKVYLPIQQLPLNINTDHAEVRVRHTDTTGNERCKDHPVFVSNSHEHMEDREECKDNEVGYPRSDRWSVAIRRLYLEVIDSRNQCHPAVDVRPRSTVVMVR